MALFAAALLAVLFFSGCGVEPQSPTVSHPSAVSAPSATPTPSLTAISGLDAVTDLRDHAVAGGYRCKNWQEEDIVPLALESGSCSDVDVFSIYSDPQDVARQIKQMRDLGPDRSALLVGDDWLINAPENRVEMLQKALGGQIKFA